MGNLTKISKLFKKKEKKSGGSQIAIYAENQNAQKDKSYWRQMFDQQKDCDIIIDVDGMEILAHKFILKSRCPYFTFLLNANEACERAVFDRFSTKCVYFALCQIYSGESEIPCDVDLFELAEFSEILNFEGLRENVTKCLEVEFFHSFHEPCDKCLMSVQRFLEWPRAKQFGDLYNKILGWVYDYSEFLWTNLKFYSLPYTFMEEYFAREVNAMEYETVLDIMSRCDRLAASLPTDDPNVYTVFQICTHLPRLCVNFIIKHLAEVISSESFSQLCNGDNDKPVGRLEEHLMTAIDYAHPAQVCFAYNCLHILVKDHVNGGSSILTRLLNHCECSLTSCASKAMDTSAWTELLPELRERILKSSGVVTRSTNSILEKTPIEYIPRDLCIENVRYLIYARMGRSNLVYERVPSTLLPVRKIYKSISQPCLADSANIALDKSNKFKSEPSLKIGKEIAVNISLKM